jgi:Caspase domain
MSAPGASLLSLRLWPFLLTCAALAATSSARADVVRFGLFVGSNRGADHEQPLRFASTDAQRMQEVLVELGGFSPLDALVLREPTADAMRGALIALNDRVRAAAARPDTQVVLFVYYSGHADPKALHLGSTQLALLELEQLVRGSAAHFRALLIDACGSGALTRSKGGAPAAPFPVGLGEELEGQGVAFLTSSSASEDAQESDELGGSFFSHYFISGLMGAADTNADERVDLEEAYRYAYAATLRSTSRTWGGTQHPTFRFDLGGKTSVVLSEPRPRSGRGNLVFPPGRDYLVLRGSPEGAVVAEIVASAARDAPRRLSVRPDRYFLRGRAGDHILEGTLAVRDGETRRVDESQLERVAYARLVRKGGSEVNSANGALAGYTLRGGLANGGALCQGVFAGYAYTLPTLTLTGRADLCTGSFENRSLQATAREFGGELRVSHAWDFPVVTLDLGFSVGGSWLQQDFETTGSAPTRNSGAFRAAIGPALFFEVGRGIYLNTDLGAETYVFRLHDSTTRETSATPSVTFRARAGVGKHW